MRVNNIAREYWRGFLLRILEQEKLLSAIRIDSEGNLMAQTQDWFEYWKPVWGIGWQKLRDSLDDLHLLLGAR